MHCAKARATAIYRNTYQYSAMEFIRVDAELCSQKTLSAEGSSQSLIDWCWHTWSTWTRILTFPCSPVLILRWRITRVLISSWHLAWPQSRSCFQRHRWLISPSALTVLLVLTTVICSKRCIWPRFSTRAFIRTRVSFRVRCFGDGDHQRPQGLGPRS